MSKQLQHDPSRLGGPCRRCGLKYTAKTAYIPCFEEGDTYGSWLARMNPEVRSVAALPLWLRTRRGFYREWGARLRAGGASEDAIRVNIDSLISEFQSLLEGKCPKCGASSARYFESDRRQGPSDVPGTWVMYRCSTQPPPGERRPDDVCDFMMDLKEVIG